MTWRASEVAKALLRAAPIRQLSAAFEALGARLRVVRVGPVYGSAAMAGLFSAIWYLVLRPGYWINDDLKAIWVLVGYPSGTGPVPFLVYSNVLLGFVLDALYGLPTQLNWAMILYAAINVFSIWVLLLLLLETRASPGLKVLGSAILLGGLGVPTINLTYTFTAALASVAGLCLLLSAAGRATRRWQARAWAGAFFLLAGSLIRLEMAVLVLVLGLPTAICLTGSSKGLRLLGAAALAGALIGAGFGFNRLYVRLHPAWNYYYAYNDMRQQLHDAHRLNNLHNQIRRVGWTPNDQELFAHWFFPDAGIYSYEHIRYLVDHTSGASQDPGATAGEFLKSLATYGGIPYLAFAAGLALWMLVARSDVRRLFMVLAPLVVTLAVNLYLAWAYKDPDYVLVSTLGASLALGVLGPTLLSDTTTRPARQNAKFPALAPAVRTCAALLVTGGTLMLVGQALASSNLNRTRADAYQKILDDLDRLRAETAISANALVVSPAHGLPYEWSYPFTLTRPEVSYFDTGWITFSPAYQRVLQDYNIRSLPQALIQDGRLYLMVDAGFTPLLQKYYLEHESADVDLVPVYAMPNAPGLPGYDDIFLYEVRRRP
jgi:hypothetical protein